MSDKAYLDVEELDNEVFEEEKPKENSGDEKEEKIHPTQHKRRATCPSGLKPAYCMDDTEQRKGRTSTTRTEFGDETVSTKANGRTMPRSESIVLRKSSTKIVIKEIPNKTKTYNRTTSGIFFDTRKEHYSTDEDTHESYEYVSPANGASWLFSGLYCMHIVILSLVLCLSEYITLSIPEHTVDYYFLVLYILAIVWLIGFNILASSCSGSAEFDEIRSNHTTNRWLKGILVVFGIAIIIENLLQILEFTQLPENCKTITAIVPSIQAVFVITEVNFLFRHSKVCIQNHKSLHRFGVIHVVATNLSVWILMVIIESTHAIYEDSHFDAPGSSGKLNFSFLNGIQIDGNASFRDCNISELLHELKKDRETLQSLGNSLIPTRKDYNESYGCECHSELCESVHTAQSFLFPFIIEFSLISSCLMYLVWRNIGRVPPQCEQVVKPSYKFYKSYTGFVAGILVLIVTVIIIVILNTSGSSLPSSEMSYDTEIWTIKIHNGFMVVLELLMTIMCLLGGYLLMKDRRPLKGHSLVDLDNVLLLVGITGSIGINLFYILAVYATLLGEDSPYEWIWGGIYPVVDLFQSVLQTAFIIYGLAREPSTSEEAKEAAEHVRQTLRDLPNEPGNVSLPAFETKEYIRQRLYTIENEGYINSAFKENMNMEAVPRNVGNKGRIENANEKFSESNLSESGNNNTPLPGYNDCRGECSMSSVSSGGEGHSSGVCADFSQEGNENTSMSKDEDGSQKYLTYEKSRAKNEAFHFEDDEFDFSKRHDLRNGGRATLNAKHRPSTIALVAKTRVTVPDSLRLWIRDIIMFLLISNACMWVFLSLQSTAFELHTYPEVFFDESNSPASQSNTWTAITMACLPLSIFFRMHSSACLFEVWSFA